MILNTQHGKIVVVLVDSEVEAASLQSLADTAGKMTDEGSDLNDVDKKHLRIISALLDEMIEEEPKTTPTYYNASVELRTGRILWRTDPWTPLGAEVWRVESIEDISGSYTPVGDGTVNTGVPSDPTD